MGRVRDRTVANGKEARRTGGKTALLVSSFTLPILLL